MLHCIGALFHRIQLLIPNYDVRGSHINNAQAASEFWNDVETYAFHFCIVGTVSGPYTRAALELEKCGPWLSITGQQAHTERQRSFLYNNLGVVHIR